MGALGGCAAVSLAGLSDGELVTAVRQGDDAAFEELYRRYNQRITGFVRGLARDEARAEDIAQEAFFSALRRLRATDSEIAFKPWIYEIARNAAIDAYRRTSRAEEISMDADDMRPADRGRLVGSRAAPDAVLVVNERMRHLRGALDELSDTHHRILVMRELEGLSYREIGERLDLTRPAVESTLFRARRRLEREYEELETGRRCESIRTMIAELAEGVESHEAQVRLARHARRCSACRRTARKLGVEPLSRRKRIAARAAAILPLPMFLRRRGHEAAGGEVTSGGQAAIGTALGPGAQVATALGERVAVLITAAALAGAGGAMLAGVPPFGEDTGTQRPAIRQSAPTPQPRASEEIRLQREAAAGSRREQSETVRPLRPRQRSHRRTPATPVQSRGTTASPRQPSPAEPVTPGRMPVDVDVDEGEPRLGPEGARGPGVPSVSIRVEPVAPSPPAQAMPTGAAATAVDLVQAFGLLTVEPSTAAVAGP